MLFRAVFNIVYRTKNYFCSSNLFFNPPVSFSTSVATSITSLVISAPASIASLKISGGESPTIPEP